MALQAGLPAANCHREGGGGGHAEDGGGGRAEHVDDAIRQPGYALRF